MILAWTSANKKETCDVLKDNPSTINPKCGRVASIRIETGIDAGFEVSNATCTAGGSIKVSPFGGIAPYKVKIGTDERTGIAAGGSTTFNLAAAGYSILLTDSRPCSSTKSRTVGSSSAPTVSAGTAFTKTCSSNATGATIGETNEATATYLWSPSAGLSSATVSNPTANPTTTTTYTVTKTSIANGCTAQASVVVTVNNTAPTVSAGTAFTKTCTSNTSGATIGEANNAPATYLWSPAAGLSSATVSNPTANPAATTTYTVTKTTTANGCTAQASVVVTVNTAIPSVTGIGGAFTKTCTSNASGATIGEANDATATYSWSPSAGLSSATVSNPTANPATTTTYTVTKTTTANGCTAQASVVVTVNNTAPTVSAGTAFTKTCTSNATGATIGETNDATATYLWSPSAGLSSATVSNPTANPAATTTYTVTKTTTANGCTAQTSVVVTVNTAIPSVTGIGGAFTKTCTSNTSGATIGETPVSGFTYAWSPASGLSDAAIGNPTANPSSTTTYMVTKTNTANGCSAQASIVVNVDVATPVAPTICVVQPSLCGPVTGSVTILSPIGEEYVYRINSSSGFQPGTLFSGLAPGSVTGIEVKRLSSGCVSSAASCEPSNCNAPRPQTANTTKTESPAVLLTQTGSGGISVKAFPNPYNDKVKLVITSPISGNGSIEVVNMLGQIVKNVFQGHIQAGTQNFEMSVPVQQRSTLIYIFRMGDKQVTGKLLQLNQ